MSILWIPRPWRLRKTMQDIRIRRSLRVMGCFKGDAHSFSLYICLRSGFEAPANVACRVQRRASACVDGNFCKHTPLSLACDLILASANTIPLVGCTLKLQLALIAVSARNGMCKFTIARRHGWIHVIFARRPAG